MLVYNTNSTCKASTKSK